MCIDRLVLHNHTWKEKIEDVSPTRVSILVQKLHQRSYPRTLALDPNRGSFCPRAGASTLGQKLRGRKCPKDGSSPGAPALGEAMSCDTGIGEWPHVRPELV